MLGLCRRSRTAAAGRCLILRLLFDQNIARKVVDLLAQDFPNSLHVATIGLSTATDREIWDFATKNGFAIVSKDADFHHLSFLYGSPPKTVWIRIGNCTTARLVSVMIRKSEAMRAFLHDEEAALLVLDESI